MRLELSQYARVSRRSALIEWALACAFRPSHVQFVSRKTPGAITLAQRTLAGNVAGQNREAQTALIQIASLRDSEQLAIENLRLTREDVSVALDARGGSPPKEVIMFAAD
jgi:hypothetical protein